MIHRIRTVLVTVLLAAGASLLSGASALASDQAAGENNTKGQQALKNLQRKEGDRVVVAIYEFRAGIGSISGRSATDMFTTALVQSGQFRVVERQRVSEGVLREKQLQQSGWASGTAGTTQLRGAQYIFEGTLSEYNQSEKAKSGGISIAGLQLGAGGNKDSLAIDVRVVDAATGDILDVISIKKPVKATTASVSGVGNLVGNVLADRGKSTTYVPDVQAQSTNRDGVDAAVRDVIDEAVLQLVKRYGAVAQQ